MKTIAKLIAISSAVAFGSAAFAGEHAKFGKVDANGDGQVTFEEGKAVHTDWTQDAFNGLDADQNGTLNEAEYKAAMKAGGDKKKM